MGKISIDRAISCDAILSMWTAPVRARRKIAEEPRPQQKKRPLTAVDLTCTDNMKKLQQRELHSLNVGTMSRVRHMERNEILQDYQFEID